MPSYHCSDNVSIEWNKCNQAFQLYIYICEWISLSHAEKKWEGREKWRYNVNDPWTGVFNEDDCQDKFNIFYELIMDAILIHTSFKKAKNQRLW